MCSRKKQSPAPELLTRRENPAYFEVDASDECKIVISSWPLLNLLTAANLLLSSCRSVSISPPSSCTLQNSLSNNVPKVCNSQSYPFPYSQMSIPAAASYIHTIHSIERSAIYDELRKRRWCITHNPNPGPLCTCRLGRAWRTLLGIDRDRIEAWESRDMGKKRVRRHPAPVPVVVPHAVQIEKDTIASNLGVIQAARQ